jgi:RNA ligase
MKINLQKFRELEGQKYLTCQSHPTAGLLIWNYSQKCQFEHHWTEETMMARGLITDLEGNIKARCLPKFFNYDEHFGDDCKLPPLPLEKFTVTEKMDGSLGILYWIDDVPYIATRGSFTSDQAIKGTEILRKKYSHVRFNPNYTYLFEVIFPANRIVVDYGQIEDLFLLAMIHTETGKEVNYEDYKDILSVVKTYKFDNIEKIKEIQEDNKEGFVIRFESGVRTKIKFEEYVRLHRIVTGVNAKTIWELLKSHQKLDELLERVPDEFYQWVRDTKEGLVDEFNIAEAVALRDYETIKNLPTRKEQAEAIAKIDSTREKKLSGIIFKLMDKRPYEDIIWKMIKPKADKPWKEEVK